MNASQPVRAVSSAPAPGRNRFVLLVIAVLIVFFNRRIAPTVHYDWFNLIPLAAVIYIGYSLIALEKTCGWIPWVNRALQPAAARRPRMSFLVSPWLRSFVLIPLFFVG